MGEVSRGVKITKKNTGQVDFDLATHSNGECCHN